MMYRKLDLEKTSETIRILQLRIEERFPVSGLSRVCAELEQLALESAENIAYIRKPIIWLRVLLILSISIGITTLIYSASLLDYSVGQVEVLDLVQALEASVNDLIFIAAAIYFLMTLENRMKRKKVLGALHELRTVAHVIDMHQLTKDPKSVNSQSTTHSPKRDMSTFELSRYLDYCSEMLSLTSKVAALYANDYKDEVALKSINEIENLCTDLSGKIWQKIMILGKEDPSAK